MQSLSWFPFSIFATISFGVAMAFYKLPSAKNVSRYAVSFWQLSICLALSVFFFHRDIGDINVTVIIYAGLWGLFFLIISVFQMKALENMDTNMLFPITSSLSLIASVCIGIVFLDDSLSSLQMMGMALLIVAIISFAYKGNKLQYSNKFLLVGVGIVASKYMQKLGADNTNINAFMMFQYFSGAIFSFLVLIYKHRSEFANKLVSGTFVPGILVAVPGFAGGLAFLTALGRGPYSLVVSVHSMYILVTAIIAYFVFNEKLTGRKVLLILLAIVAIILVKIG